MNWEHGASCWQGSLLLVTPRPLKPLCRMHWLGHNTVKPVVISKEIVQTLWFWWRGFMTRWSLRSSPDLSMVLWFWRQIPLLNQMLLMQCRLPDLENTESIVLKDVNILIFYASPWTPGLLPSYQKKFLIETHICNQSSILKLKNLLQQWKLFI